MKNTSLKTNLLIAIMAAIICVLAPLSISIPFSPVPITLTNLAIYVFLYVFGTRMTTIAFMIYMFLGFIGVPVFSGFTGGAVKLLGPTGGYIIGFMFLSVVSGIIIEKFEKNLFICFLGLVLGTLILYIFGTIWLALVLNITFIAALPVGVIPFIPGDMIKMIVATIIGPKLRRVKWIRY